MAKRVPAFEQLSQWAESSAAKLEAISNYLSVRDVYPAARLDDFLGAVADELVTSAVSLQAVIERYDLKPSQAIKFACDYLDNVPLDANGNPETDMTDYAEEVLSPSGQSTPTTKASKPAAKPAAKAAPVEEEEEEDAVEDEEPEDEEDETEPEDDETEPEDEEPEDEDDETEEASDETEDEEEQVKPASPKSRAAAAAAKARKGKEVDEEEVDDATASMAAFKGKEVTHPKRKGTGHVVSVVAGKASIQYADGKLLSVPVEEVEIVEEVAEEEPPAKKPAGKKGAKAKPAPARASKESKAEAPKLPVAKFLLSAAEIKKANEYLAMKKLATDVDSQALITSEVPVQGAKLSGAIVITNTMSPEKVKAPWLDLYLVSKGGTPMDVSILGPRPKKLPATIDVTYGDNDEKIRFEITSK